VCLEVGDRRDNLTFDGFQRRDPLHIFDTAHDSLNPHPGEPAQPLDELTCPGAVLTHIEGENVGLRDRVVIISYNKPSTRRSSLSQISQAKKRSCML
jgi:hypothetical protein